MFKTSIKSYLACFMAAFVLITSLSGISLAWTYGQGSDYSIIQLDEVTIAEQSINTKELAEPEEAAMYDDDDEVIFIAEMEDDAVLESYGTMSTTDAGRTLTPKGIILQKEALEAQNLFMQRVKVKCSKAKLRCHFTLMLNAVSFSAPYGMRDALSRISGIKNLSVAPELYVPQVKFDTDSMYPTMYSAGSMVDLQQVWDLGYEGKGTLISIVDSGLYCEHEAFQTEPESPKYTKSDIAKILDQNNLQAESIMQEQNLRLSADDVYYNGKVVYKFDYNLGDTDVNHGGYPDSMDHGTHVAGIAAGVPTSEMNGISGLYARGMAPQAQLAIMKVFPDRSGGAPWDIIVAGVEDSMYIGADVVNLSLGSASGFPTQEEQYAKIYDILDEYGVSIMAAAGNDTSSAYTSTWGTDYPTTENVDSSVVDSPSTCGDSLSVAAVYNTSKYFTEYIKIGDRIIGYADSAKDQGGKPDLLIDKALGAQTIEVVAVPEYGREEDYAGVDVTGKIALVQRGNGTFADKMTIAANHGAVAMVVYNNRVEGYLTSMTITSPVIPAVFISQENGLYIKECIANGTNTMYISDGSGAVSKMDNGGVPADFSAWGPLCTLQIKPEISAPGGNIMSAVDPTLTGAGQLYGSMSGTSMATPAVSGAAAIVRQYVNEAFPNKTPLEKVELVNTLLMCTATPLKDANGAEYSVRKQGAGLINMPAAVSTKAYLSVNGNVRPKLEIGDDPSRSGEYTLEFDVTNFGTETLQYEIVPRMLTGGYEYIDQGTRATNVSTLESLDLTDRMTFITNHTDNKVSVAPGATEHIKVVMKMDESAHKELKEVYPFGTYIEGYCYLKAVVDAEGARVPDLSMCYLGFYGSWSEVPVIDNSFYYNKPEDNLGMMAYPNSMCSRYKSGYMEAGMNPYFDGTEDESITANFEFLADRISISPANADRKFDKIDTVYTGIMRNLQSFYYTITDKDTNELLWENVMNGEIRKNLSTEADRCIYPMGYAISKITAWEAPGQAEGSTAIIRCGGVPYMDNFDPSVAKRAYWELPVTVDNSAPYIVESWSEGETLYVKIKDNHYAAYAGVFANEGDKQAIASYCIAEQERGAETVIAIDMNGMEKAYLLLGDYACNEAQFEIKKDSDGGMHETYYELCDKLEPDSNYIIVSDDSLYSTGSIDYALTDTNAQPGSVRLQGIRTEISDSVISGEKYGGIIWHSLPDGTIKNCLSNKYLGIVSNEGSYWLGTTETNTVHWTYTDGTLAHDFSATENNMLVYAETIVNGGAAFDITNDSQAAGRIRIYREHPVVKTADCVTLYLDAKQAGTSSVDVTMHIKDNRDVTSGIVMVTYDQSRMTVEKAEKSSLLESGTAQFNSTVQGRVTAAFNAGDGKLGAGEVFSIRFNMNCTTETIVAFDLYCSELYSGSQRQNTETKGAVCGGIPSSSQQGNTVKLTAQAEKGNTSNEINYKAFISENSDAASGIYVVTYNSDALQFTKHKAGDAMGDAMVMVNSSTPGTLRIAFAGMEPLDSEGGVISEILFSIKDGKENYGLVEFKIEPVELLADDTVTVIPSEGSICTYYIGNGEPVPTETPTSVPTETPTATPSAAPTAAPTSEPVPTDPPTPPITGAQAAPYAAVILAIVGMAGMSYFFINSKTKED